MNRVMRTRHIKRIVLRIMFLIEVIFFGYIFIYGVHGVMALRAMRFHNSSLAESVGQIRSDVARLDNDIHEWVKYPYYREKIAREQLQMAYKDDRIFYLQK